MAFRPIAAAPTTTAGREHRPAGRQLFTVPAGGVHVWLLLPESCSEADVVVRAAASGLIVGPGRMSFPGEPPAPYLRLSYAEADSQALVTGIGILAAVLGES